MNIPVPIVVWDCIVHQQIVGTLLWANAFLCKKGIVYQQIIGLKSLNSTSLQSFAYWLLS